MIKLIKKSLIVLLLITINIINRCIKIIYNFYTKNKNKIKKYYNGIYTVLKEELAK